MMYYVHRSREQGPSASRPGQGPGPKILKALSNSEPDAASRAVSFTGLVKLASFLLQLLNAFSLLQHSHKKYFRCFRAESIHVQQALAEFSGQYSTCLISLACADGHLFPSQISTNALPWPGQVARCCPFIQYGALLMTQGQEVFGRGLQARCWHPRPSHRL